MKFDPDAVEPPPNEVNNEWFPIHHPLMRTSVVASGTQDSSYVIAIVESCFKVKQEQVNKGKNGRLSQIIDSN